MTSRRKTRELALSSCYEIEVGKQNPEQVIERVLEENELDSRARVFLRESITTAVKYTPQVDKIIEELAIGWKLDRIAESTSRFSASQLSNCWSVSKTRLRPMQLS